MPTIDFDASAPQQNAFRSFSAWTPWSARESLRDPWGHALHEYGGIYVLAHFDGPPPAGDADYLAPEIVYVGEGGWLRGRWRQFARSAFRGLSGHSGGHSYRAKHAAAAPPLSIAVLPVWFGDSTETLQDWTTAFRLFAERRIIWDITAARGGGHGLLNKK